MFGSMPINGQLLTRDDVKFCDCTIRFGDCNYITIDMLSYIDPFYKSKGINDNGNLVVNSDDLMPVLCKLEFTVGKENLIITFNKIKINSFIEITIGNNGSTINSTFDILVEGNSKIVHRTLKEGEK
jgi:hypothetical protein